MKAICGTFVGFAKFFVIFVLLGTIFQACSDDGEREKDVFGFEGGSKDKILTIEVVIHKMNPCVLRQMKIKAFLKALLRVQHSFFFSPKLVKSVKMSFCIFLIYIIDTKNLSP